MASFNHFKAIANALPEVFGEIIDHTATQCQHNIQGFIQSNGQVKTGNMLNSVHVEAGEDEQTKLVVVGALYGIFQNYGTRYMPGRPFVEPGAEQTRPGFEAELGTLESRLARRI